MLSQSEGGQHRRRREQEGGARLPEAMTRSHTDAFVIVDGKVQPTAGNRAIEGAHVRTVISKYGGVIRQAAAAAIPPQTKGGYSRALHVRSTQPQDGKGHGDNSNRDRAGGWMVG